MAPLTNEIRPVEGFFPPHLGPATPEVSSVWFKMFLYHFCGSGPPSLLLPKGFKICRLPKIFEQYGRLLVTTWGHDPTDIPISGALSMLLDALQHSPVLIQAFSSARSGESGQIRNVPFPLSTEDQDKLEQDLPNAKKMLPSCVNIRHCCGYISMLKLQGVDSDDSGPKNGEMNEENANLLQEEVDNISDSKLELKLNNPRDEGKWMLLDIKFGVPLFDSDLNKAICQSIIYNSFWKSDNLNAMEKSGQELGKMLKDFIVMHQDLPLNDVNGKIWCTPEERRKSPVPLPTRVLFFDGQTLHEKI